MSPRVSIIMAAYNGAALIEETLASLRAQTFDDFEIVAVDDASTDDTLAVLRAWPDPRLRVIESAANGGPVRARNRAVAEARGEYLAALDQDDLCRPERLARQVAYLDAHPPAVLVGTGATMLEDDRLSPSSYAPVTTPTLIGWLLRIENPLVWSSVMLRAEAARALDPFTRPDLLYAEDFDLYHRLSRLGRIARLDEELLVYRHHPGGASKRFTERMLRSATAVLTENYRPLLGDEAEAAAGLVATHVMGRLPAPDRDTLGRLGAVLLTLQGDFLASRPVARDDRRLIRWETARRWARVKRASLRSGTITLADAVAVRPQHLGLGYAAPEELAWSGLIGGARKVARSYRAGA